jgi:zinc protease
MSYAQSIKEKRLSFGGKLLLAPFPAGGLISFAGSIVTGARKSMEDELAHVHAQMLMEGSARFTKKELQVELDTLGASLAFDAGTDRLQFRARVRAEHAERLLDLIAESLLHPTFPKTELEVLKKRELANLQMQSQDTNAQATIAASRMLYPKDHANYELSTKESVAALKKITVPMLQKYHVRILNRGTLVLAAAGDFRKIKVEALVERYFAALPKKKVATPSVKKALKPKAGRKAVHIKEKASIDYIAAIAPGITNAHKDYPALLLGLQILGNRGGFTGRLMQIVREKEGLTYGVYSYPSGFSSRVDGHIMAWGTFAPQLFAQGRTSMLRELRRIIAEGPTEEEVRKHAKLFDARFKVNLSNAGALARAAHDTMADQKPLTHLDTFPQKILKLNVKKVHKVLRKYIDPDKMAEAAAGPLTKIG